PRRRAPVGADPSRTAPLREVPLPHRVGRWRVCFPGVDGPLWERPGPGRRGFFLDPQGAHRGPDHPLHRMQRSETSEGSTHQAPFRPAETIAKVALPGPLARPKMGRRRKETVKKKGVRNPAFRVPDTVLYPAKLFWSRMRTPSSTSRTGNRT